MPTTGEKPGKGTYRCDTCGELVVLDDDTDTLPHARDVIIPNTRKSEIIRKTAAIV